MLDLEVLGLQRYLLLDNELRESVDIFRKVTRLRHASNYTRCASRTLSTGTVKSGGVKTPDSSAATETQVCRTA
jgi:hypothetical protein